MFNAAFLSTPVETAADLTQRLLIANMHFSARGREWAWWMCEDWLEPRLRRRARQLLERQGLRHSTDLPGMCADRILPPPKPLPALAMRRVGDDTTRLAFCEIGSVCFHLPISWFREVVDIHRGGANFGASV